MPVFDPPIFDPPVFEGDEESPSGASHTNWVTLDCECPCSDGFSGSGPIDVICENGTPRTIPAYMNGTFSLSDPTLAAGCVWDTMCCYLNCTQFSFPWENGRTYGCRRIFVLYYTVGPFTYPYSADYALGTLSTREAFDSVGAPDPYTWGCYGPDGDTVVVSGFTLPAGYPYWEYVGVCEITPGLSRNPPVYYVHHFISIIVTIKICPGEFYIDEEVVSRTCATGTVKHMLIIHTPAWDDMGTPMPETWDAVMTIGATGTYANGDYLNMYNGVFFPNVTVSPLVCQGEIIAPSNNPTIDCGFPFGVCDDDNWGWTNGPSFDFFNFSGCDNPPTNDHYDGKIVWGPG